jgi:polysaccharide biosynthesis protein PslH
MMGSSSGAIFISPTIPASSGNGLAMRMGMFAQALARISRLEVIVLPLFAETPGAEAFLRRNDIRLHIVDLTGRLDTHFSLLSQITDEQQRLEAFRRYCRPSLCRFLSQPILNEISRIVNACQPDIIHIGRSYLMPCIDFANSRVATVDLDEDDLSNFTSQAKLVKAAGLLHKAAWLQQEGIACDELIATYAPRFTKIFISNRKDGLQISRRHRGITCEVLENAVNIPPRVPARDDGETLVFIGSMSYSPNSEGVLWFAREVLPKIRASGGANCRLLIAGPTPPPSIQAIARHPRVTVLDWIPNVNAFYQHATVALAPLRAGGGTRIKLLEASAHRVASVSTREASTGIGWPDKVGGWRADSASDIARVCQVALSQRGERQRRAEDGLLWVRQHHDRKSTVSVLSRNYLGSLR